MSHNKGSLSNHGPVEVNLDPAFPVDREDSRLHFLVEFANEGFDQLIEPHSGGVF